MTSQLRQDCLFKYLVFVYSCSPEWQNALSERINGCLGTKYQRSEILHFHLNLAPRP